LYIVLMLIVVDANIFISVILNEPEKEKIIELTRNSELVAPEILPYEIGNALSAMHKKRRLEKEQILDSYNFYKKIPVRLVEVKIEKALDISFEHDIYAYDAYYLETAKRMKSELLTLDQKMKEVANKMNVPLMEV